MRVIDRIHWNQSLCEITPFCNKKLSFILMDAEADEWNGIIGKVMEVDNSWNNTAGKYIEVYNSARVWLWCYSEEDRLPSIWINVLVVVQLWTKSGSTTPKQNKNHRRQIFLICFFLYIAALEQNHPLLQRHWHHKKNNQDNNLSYF